MDLKKSIASKKAESAELAARNEAIDARQTEILKTAEDAKRDLSDEERDEYDKLEAEYADNTNRIATLDGDVVRLEAKLARSVVETPKPRRTETTVSAPVETEKTKNAGPNVPKDDENADDGLVPDAQLRHPSDVQIVVRAPEFKTFSGTRHGLSAPQRAYRAGSYVLARIADCLPGFLSPEVARGAQDFCSRYMVTPHDSSGYSSLVPDEFEADMIVLREKYGVGRGLLEYKNMSRETKTINKRKGAMTAKFVGAVGTGTNTNANVIPIMLVAKKIRAQSTYSIDLDDDAIADIGDDFMNEIAHSFAVREDQCIFNGDGSSNDNYGGIKGLIPTLGAGGKISATGTAWTSITAANIDAMIAKLPAYAEERDNVCFVCHKSFYYTVMAPLTLSLGGANKSDAETKAGAMYRGFPVKFVQVMPNVTPADNSVTDTPLMLGDFRMAGLFGDRRQITIDFTRDATLDGVNTFEEDQIGVKGTERFDVNIHDGGDASTAGAYVGLTQTGPA